jgi:hypothetical protein
MQVTYTSPMVKGDSELDTLPSGWLDARSGKCQPSAPVCMMPLTCGTTYMVRTMQSRDVAHMHPLHCCIADF